MPLNEWEQKEYEEKGIKKKDLKDGAYYSGKGRGTTIARYNAKDECFYYLRTKWGSEFVDCMRGPENALDGLAYFLPVEEIILPSFEIKIKNP